MTSLTIVSSANDVAKQLYELMYKNGYNRNIRPVIRERDVIDVAILLKMAQTIDLDERNHIPMTNVWVVQVSHS